LPGQPGANGIRYKRSGYCTLVTKDSFYVEVKPALTLALGNDRAVCPDVREVTFTSTVNPDGSGLDYRWSTGATTPHITVSQPGRYSLEITNGVCSARDTVQLSRLSLPKVRFPADNLYCLSEGPITLAVEAQQADLNFLWLPGEGNQSVQIISVPGTYQVLITNPDGCTVAQLFTVNKYCQPRIAVPDAFSPNGDGQNDELELFHEGVSDVEWLTYNRWGSVIFYTTDLAKRWDGTYRGAPCDRVFMRTCYGTNPPWSQPVLPFIRPVRLYLFGNG